MASSSSDRPAIWEQKIEKGDVVLANWLQKTLREAGDTNKILTSTQQLLFNNLIRAVKTLHVVEIQADVDDEGNNRKRKRSHVILKDPFAIWFQNSSEMIDGQLEWDESQDDLPETDGGKLAVMSVAGILNAISGYKLCQSTRFNIKTIFTEAVRSGVAKQLTEKLGNGVDILKLHAVAEHLHASLALQVKNDILRTTPRRIQTLLAPDLSPSEFSSIRRRIYETVVLGRGLQTSDESSELATGPASAVHDLEKFKKCPHCGNNDQAEFVSDRKNGDVICNNCGTVVAESLMHEGSQYRKFEGEQDRNHHGDAANPLYSNAHNMGTSLSGVAASTGAGIGGWGSGGSNKNNLETVLKNVHTYTELNVSQFGKTDRRTRTGYKDKQKKDAFLQMTHAGDSLNLHEAVVQRAKELFAGFRDDRELLQQFKGVLAACLCESFEQLSTEGKHILRQQQQQYDQQNQRQDMAKPRSARAARRDRLHNASMAGKGGLLLNQKEVVSEKEEPKSTSILKPAAQWDLDDCRTWLLQASRSIAQHWVNERKKGTPESKKLPNGTLEQLEGDLAEHGIKLCVHLEKELQTKESVSGAKSRVQTRRVDMANLGIKWQHSHERGSGGSGGVGGSGKFGKTAQVKHNRTAGQILQLKSAKKLGDILNDPVAGVAIHRELREVINKQNTQKGKLMREDATRQRINQMQRKPWLRAKLQQS